MGFFDRLRSPRADRVEAREALYVHLATDGAIVVVRGDTGEQLWTDRGGLRSELERTKQRGGTLLYSRDDPGEEPPAHVEETFREIVEFGLPVRLIEQPHPEALVSPERRRTVTKDEL
jgi:hypothetical protein